MTAICKSQQVTDPAVNLQKPARGRPPAVSHRVGKYQVGENNHKSKLTDHEVELMRKLHEEHPEGHAEHWGYRRLAGKFGVTKTLARKICNYVVRVRLTPR